MERVFHAPRTSVKRAFWKNGVTVVEQRERAVLVLEDGTSYTGWAMGARGKVFGEVVFTTAMTGYQETLTDPSFRGEIVTMTYPLIGNYGVNPEDVESQTPHVRGFVVRELCDSPSNWRARQSLSAYLEAHGIVGLEGVDTRALTRVLREKGTMRGVLATGDGDVARLAQEAAQASDLSSQDLVSEVTVARSYVYAEGPGPRVTVIDCGAKNSIMRSLASRGCTVTVVPAHARAEEVLATRPDGVIVSNGPGDPKAIPYVVETVRQLIPTSIPLFGICLGHQVIARAFGGETYRLKYGHRGANHPVKDLRTGRVYITSQNHGFAVQEGSWSDPDLVVTHRNVNDGTVEGLAHRTLPVRSVQYHPEASPGPSDSAYLFDEFISMLGRPA